MAEAGTRQQNDSDPSAVSRRYLITTVPEEGPQLFVSFVSATVVKLSAHASRKYVPNGVVAGTLTVTDPFEVAP